MRGTLGVSRIALVGGALALVLGLGPTAAQDATPTGAMSVEEITAVTADQEYKLLAVVKTLSNEYWQTMERGYQEAATEKGVTIDVHLGADRAGYGAAAQPAADRPGSGLRRDHGLADYADESDPGTTHGE